jgi:hypothetical protein
MKLNPVVRGFVLAAGLLQISSAQETLQIFPDDVVRWVKEADSVVVGTFRAVWPVPWIDGWHYQSRIEVREQLFPLGAPKSVSISWVRPFGLGCLICRDLRPFDNQSGIWLLRRRNGGLEIFGGSKFCDASLNTSYIDAVRAAVRTKPQP